MKVSGLVLTCLLTFSGAVHSAERPNVLFIAADDLRNDLGFYGHPLVKTPNLDRLAARSVVFNRGYCQQALCNPSRASLLCSRQPDTLRIWNLTTHYRNHPTPLVPLPQHFKEHGYFTQGVGKLFHNWKDPALEDQLSWSVPARMHIGVHGDDKPHVEGLLPPNLAKHPKCECHDVPDEAYYDGRIATLAIEALQQCAEHAKTQPFFLGVGFWKPHSPFNAPKKYWDLYRREDVPPPSPAEWPADAPRIAWHNSRELLGNAGVQPPPEAIQEIRHGYLANISYLDAQVGRVLDELERLKLADRTIIVLWADHGYHLGEQTLWAKTSNFELDARVPLLFALPGAREGRKTDAIAGLIDIYPTLSELCGLPQAEGLEGVSQAPVLRGDKAAVRTAAMTQHPRPAYYQGAPDAMGYSVRTDRFRYTEWRDWKTGETLARELYDHRLDPDETRNLVDDPAHAADVQVGIAALETFHPIVRPGWEPMLPVGETEGGKR